MRIFHLLASDACEDDLITIGQLLGGLDACHFDQDVVCLDGATAEWAGRVLGVDVRRLHLRFGGYVGAGGPGWTANRRPHLVHVWGGDPTPLRSLLGSDDLAVVVTADPLRAGRSGPQPRLRRLYRRLTLVCNSTAVRDAVVRCGHEASRCVVVRPGVDVHAGDARRPGPTRDMLRLPDGHPVLMTPGPPSRRGGQYYAVWAAALLQQIFPDVRLIVPGDASERARLERFARSFELPEIVVCTQNRWLSSELMGVADVLVAPVLTDGSTGTVARAMAAGLPVVASDVPAMRETVEDGVTGLMAPPGQPTKLAGAVLRVIEDAGLRGQLTQAARQHATQAYPVNRFIEQYEAVYERAFAHVRTLAMGR